jgi:ABC-type spermidine/putrescine transport system permease subunit I
MTRLRHDPTAIFMLPAFLMLAVAFLIPLAGFFVQVLLVEQQPGTLLPAIQQIITSKATLTAVMTTNWIAILVTLFVLIAGYPIAYYLTQANSISASLVIFSIVVPYFTSIIVRTYSWMVLLGRTGIINTVLEALGLIHAPLPLLYNKAAVVIGMAYVLLPYMILTLYAAMKAIDMTYVRAARGLGAGGLYTFWRVYFPLSLPGVLSGSLIVFILATGFFITPALMGGPSDVLIAMLIERAVEINVDWASAAILSLLLLAVTLLLYAVYFRMTDVRRLVGAGR